MKILAAAACLLFATSLLQAQMPPAATPVSPAAPATKAAPGKAAPAKKVEKKAEVLPKIPGIEVPRGNGTFLGLEIVGGNFKLSFYDKKKKLMGVDVTRATARWPNTRTNTPSEYRTVLNGSGTALVGTRVVLPPLVFNVYLTLLQGEGDDAKAVENYVVPFRG